MRADHDFEIDAPPAVVWQLLTDVSRYAEWNPFVVSCALPQGLEVGAPIEMRVRIFPFLTQPQREWISEAAPEKGFAYVMRGMPRALLASHRSHALEALGEGRTRYVSRFALEGALAPLVAFLMGRRLEVGFAAMGAALKRQAEARVPA